MARRKQIIDVAIDLFTQSGYESVTIEDINDACGIARGTFYIYFKNKEALLAEILNVTFNALLNEIITKLPTIQEIPQYEEEMAVICEVAFNYFKDKVGLQNLVVLSRTFGSIDIEVAREKYLKFFVKRFSPAPIFMGIPEHEIEIYLITRFIALHSTIAYAYTQHPDKADDYKKMVTNMISIWRFP